MKNALLTALTLLGLSAFAPRAEAGGWFRVSNRYDRCERPVDYRSRDCYGSFAPTYYRTYRTYRPSYSSFSRPAYLRDSCYSTRRGYSSSPRFAIYIGF